MYPQDQMNDLIIDKLKEIRELEDNIELDNIGIRSQTKS